MGNDGLRGGMQSDAGRLAGIGRLADWRDLASITRAADLAPPGPREGGLGEDGLGEDGLGEDGLGEDGLGEDGLGEDGLGEGRRRCRSLSTRTSTDPTGHANHVSYTSLSTNGP
jgi:hypothetical protein